MCYNEYEPDFGQTNGKPSVFPKQWRCFEWLIKFPMLASVAVLAPPDVLVTQSPKALSILRSIRKNAVTAALVRRVVR